MIKYIFTHTKNFSWHKLPVLVSFFIYTGLSAQPAGNSYYIREGKMNIRMSKQTKAASIDSFMLKYDLTELDLRNFIQKNRKDSILKQGWKFEENNANFFIISKPLLGADNFNNPLQAIRLTEIVLPVFNNPVQSVSGFGINSFRSKVGFPIKDSTVTFVLNNNLNANKVLLSGNFTNWKQGAVPMQKNENGWFVNIKLNPGKYLYKFIIDGKWVLDNDNKLTENDGSGNTNSVYYLTNYVFSLRGYPNAKNIFVAGNFNQWKRNSLRLIKNKTGWYLPIYLPNGTQIYRFIVDGNWIADPDNTNVLPNEYNSYNSVLTIGKKQLFKLDGFLNAKRIYLTGSFNGWRNSELAMNKTASGWQLLYATGPGNYEYKFVIDGKWCNGEGREADHNAPGSVFIVDPNYTFILKGHPNAGSVYITGDFNQWSKKGFPMKRKGDVWSISLNLSEGKHLYKFIVDGKWILDPGNKLWEQNEYGTGNSIIWMKTGR